MLTVTFSSSSHRGLYWSSSASSDLRRYWRSSISFRFAFIILSLRFKYLVQPCLPRTLLSLRLRSRFMGLSMDFMRSLYIWRVLWGGVGREGGGALRPWRAWWWSGGDVSAAPRKVALVVACRAVPRQA